MKQLCSTCKSSFANKASLKLHHATNIQCRPKPAVFRCPKSNCTVEFARPDAVKRHINSVHVNEKEKTNKCEKCDKTFCRKDTYKRHLESRHPDCTVIKGNLHRSTMFECAECAAKFARKDNLLHHILTKHSTEECEVFECHYCGFETQYKYSMKKHIQKAHVDPSKPLSTIKKTCVLCGLSFDVRGQVLKHYTQDHGVQLSKEVFHFQSGEEFLEWKKNKENSTKSRFFKYTNSRSETATKYVYFCHRSGDIRLKKDRKRRLKLNGSKKLDAVCPAEIRFSQNNFSGECQVSYFGTHLGHSTTDEKEIRFLHLHKDDRLELATKIAAGIPIHRTLTDNEDDTLLYDYLHTKLARTDLLSNQDIYNVQRSFHIKANKNRSHPCDNEELDVEILLNQYADFILYYKRPDEPCDNYPFLKNEDLVLIIMCPTQEKMLKKHGHDIIAIDGTHGTNSHGFILHTLMVLDYDDESYPAAFAVSNCNDSVVIDVFLSCIQEEVGCLQPNTLMTDMQETYINSWMKVNGIPRFRLYGMWHVKEAWRKHSRKINNLEKRKIVMNNLYDMSSEVDEKRFTEKLNEFIKMNDCDIAEFVKYFTNEFVKSVKCWAYCFRQYACINSNMQSEVFYQGFKYLHGEWKNVKSLAGGLLLLMTYLRLQTKQLAVKWIYGQITHKLKLLRRHHNLYVKYASEHETQIIVENYDEEKKYLVKSFAPSKDELVEEMYVVQKIRDVCPAKEDPDYRKCNLVCVECNECAHIYSCSCVENAVKNIMCKHIHLVCSLQDKEVYSLGNQ